MSANIGESSYKPQGVVPLLLVLGAFKDFRPIKDQRNYKLCNLITEILQSWKELFVVKYLLMWQARLLHSVR